MTNLYTYSQDQAERDHQGPIYRSHDLSPCFVSFLSLVYARAHYILSPSLPSFPLAFLYDSLPSLSRLLTPPPLLSMFAPSSHMSPHFEEIFVCKWLSLCHELPLLHLCASILKQHKPNLGEMFNRGGQRNKGFDKGLMYISSVIHGCSN